MKIEEESLLNLCSGPKQSSSWNIQDAKRANLNALEYPQIRLKTKWEI
jgi:hypothetical protein